MSGVVDISRGRLDHKLVCHSHEICGPEAEIIKDDEVRKHAAPELHPSLESISLRHEGHGDHMILLRPRLPGHQVKLAHLIGKSNSRDQVGTDRDVEHSNSGHRGWDPEQDKGNEGKHLSYL